MRPHRDPPPGNRANGRWPQAYGRPILEDDEGCGYVLHLPVAVPDLASAVDVGRAVVSALRCLSGVEVGSASLSEEGRPDRHRALCCNRRLAGVARCLLPPLHATDCAEEP